MRPANGDDAEVEEGERELRRGIASAGIVEEARARDTDSKRSVQASRIAQEFEVSERRRGELLDGGIVSHGKLEGDWAYSVGDAVQARRGKSVQLGGARTRRSVERKSGRREGSGRGRTFLSERVDGERVEIHALSQDWVRCPVAGEEEARGKRQAGEGKSCDAVCTTTRAPLASRFRRDGLSLALCGEVRKVSTARKRRRKEEKETNACAWGHLSTGQRESLASGRPCTRHSNA